MTDGSFPESYCRSVGGECNEIANSEASADERAGEREPVAGLAEGRRTPGHREQRGVREATGSFHPSLDWIAIVLQHKNHPVRLETLKLQA